MEGEGICREAGGDAADRDVRGRTETGTAAGAHLGWEGSRAGLACMASERGLLPELVRGTLILTLGEAGGGGQTMMHQKPCPPLSAFRKEALPPDSPCAAALLAGDRLVRCLLVISAGRRRGEGGGTNDGHETIPV